MLINIVQIKLYRPIISFNRQTADLYLILMMQRIQI